MKKNHTRLLCLLGIGALLFGLFCSYAALACLPRVPKALAAGEERELAARYKAEQGKPLLRALSYETAKPAPVHAQAAIIIDASNGSILFEKNADTPIPPASMTKLVVMYIALEEVEAGRIHLSDTVPLNPEAWAVNAPPLSSLMFLGENQRVTLEELLLGLAVASGNDAAVAVAQYVSGSVAAFVERMNAEMVKLGLTLTHFVEPSGYDENNITTAREFALFCREYVRRFPQTLERYHSAKQISYPLAHNMPPGLEHTYAPYIQKATNRLLDELAGCDGLKTGFIYESGYNIAVTAERDGTRFISVTLGGPGKGAVQGNRYRVADGKNLFEWAFAHFYTFTPDTRTSVPVRVWEGKAPAVNLTEYAAKHITVPREIPGDDNRLTRTLDIPDNLVAPVKKGAVYGKAVYTAGGLVLAEYPLIADRTVEQANPLKQLLDRAVLYINELQGKGKTDRQTAFTGPKRSQSGNRRPAQPE